jgi:small GTP-binding protein
VCSDATPPLTGAAAYTGMNSGARSPALLYTLDDIPKDGRFYVHDPELSHTPLDDVPIHGSPKIILVGDAFVGKTCLVNCMKTATFKANYNPTIGTGYLKLMGKLHGEDVRLDCWDTGGTEKTTSLTQHYYRGSDLALLCFDLNSPSSFVNVGRWHADLVEHCDSEIRIFLVGCKADLDIAVGEAEI